MTEQTYNVIGSGGLKLADIWCATTAEMQCLDVARYLPGTKCYPVQDHTLYILDSTSGSWYDVDGNSVLGLGSSLGDITFTLTNLESDGDEIAYNLKACTFTIKPGTGYDLPTSVTITIGGEAAVEDTDYTYNAETGVIAFPAAKVTGAIVITAAGVAQSVGNITFDLTEITSAGDTEAFYETQVDVTLTAATNYDLPTAITVTIGGAAATVDVDYTYNTGTGVIVIAAAKVIGAIAITAIADPESQGSITYTLSNVTKASGDTTAYYKTEIEAVIAAAQYYDLPATITVTVGDTPLVVDDDYTYNDTTGAIVINADAVTAAVVIAATGTAEEYDVTLTLTNLTATGDETATYGEDIDVTLSAAENYDLPTAITVTIGEAEAVEDTDYTYNSGTGAIHIAGAKVIGAVTITAAATGESQGAITLTLTNVTADGDTEAFYDTEISTILTAAENYELPATITVTVDAAELEVDTDYTYDDQTGEVVIYAAAVTGAVVITATATGVLLGDVVYVLANLTVDGDTKAYYKTQVDATIAPEEGYDLPTSIIVVINDEEAVENTDYTYSSVTGEIVITANSVVGIVEITALGKAEV